MFQRKHYYSERSGEIDFVIQYGTSIIPVEVKGGEDKSAPTFKKYVSEHQLEYAVRFSKREYRGDGYITNMPLYLAKKDERIIMSLIIKKYNHNCLDIINNM